MNNDKWIETKKFFPEALLVAIITAVGYIGAFSYQYSYLQYFQIPFFLIDINLLSVLLVTVFGLFFLSAIVLVVDYSMRCLKAENNRNKKRLVKILVAIFLFLILSAVAYNPTSILSTVIRVFVLVVIVIWNFVLLKNDKFKQEHGNLLKKAEGLYGSFPVLFVSILLLFIATCGVSGGIVAKFQTNYLVTNTTPQLAIVSTYTGNLLGVAFSADSKDFEGGVTILSQDRISSGNIILNNRKVGPLKRSLEGESIFEILFPNY